MQPPTVGEWHAALPPCPQCGRPDLGNIIERVWVEAAGTIHRCVVRCRHRTCRNGYVVEVLVAAELSEPAPQRPKQRRKPSVVLAK